MSIEIRIAEDSDGPAIGALARENGFGVFEDGDWDIDWSRVNPSWLVAEDDGRTVGAIQVLLARPIGRLELMFIDPELPLRGRADVVKRLLTAGLATIRGNGILAVMSTVPDNLESYKRVLERHYNGVEMSDGWVMGARLG